MNINDLLTRNNMTRYRLAKQSGVSQSSMTDICSGKAKLKNCSGETLYRISKALGVSMESLLEDVVENRQDFETYKNEVRLRARDMGDLDFIIDTLETSEISSLWEKKLYNEAIYLLAVVDSLSRENDLPLCADYADIRKKKIETEARNAV